MEPSDSLSAEEIELLKLVDLKDLLEIEAPAASTVEQGKQKKTSIEHTAALTPTTPSVIYRQDPKEVASHLREQTALRARLEELLLKNEALVKELGSLKSLLQSKSGELTQSEQKMKALEDERKKVLELLENRQREFDKKIVESEQAFLEGLKQEREAFQENLRKEQAASDERIEKERLFREKLEEETKSHQARAEELQKELENTKQLIDSRDKTTSEIHRKLEAVKSIMEEKNRMVEETRERLKVAEAEKTLLASDLQQKQKTFEAQLAGREKHLTERIETERAQFEANLRKERIEADAKLFREKAVRQTLEQQKTAYNERMIELAWQLKEEKRRPQPPSVEQPVVEAKPLEKKTIEVNQPKIELECAPTRMEDPVSSATTDLINEIIRREMPRAKEPEIVARVVTPTPAPIVIPEPILEPVASGTQPVAAASEIRRFAAGVVDLIFVWTLFLGAIVFTANGFTDFDAGISPKVLLQFQNPVFVRIVLTEYLAIGFLYYFIALAFLPRTCGMWVWDIHVAYGVCTGPLLILKKSVRIALSVFSLLLLFPIPFLAVTRQGKNFIDFLSGSLVLPSGTSENLVSSPAASTLPSFLTQSPTP